jgi:hypothetical protein
MAGVMRRRGTENGLPVNGRYVGYVDGGDPLHGFLSWIIRDVMSVRESRAAFRAFRLSGSNVVYAYQEKFSGVTVICTFYGPRAGKARQEYEGLETLRRYNLIGSPHHVIRPLGFNRDINGVLAVEYYAGEEFSRAIAHASVHRDIFGAREAGLTTVMFDSDQGKKAYRDCVPDYSITDLRDLLAILGVQE